MKKPRFFTREEKLSVLARMAAGANVSKLARELKIRRKLLYAWRDNFRKLGPAGLRTRGRPPLSQTAATRASAPPATGAVDELALSRERIAELERKIGQQQLELDFFRAALRQVNGKQVAGAGNGASPSTRSSKR